MTDTHKYKSLIARTENSAESSSNDYLSTNRIATASLNFPITWTCNPSKVCIKTCYGLAGQISLQSSLGRQIHNYRRVQANPIKAACDIAWEIEKKKLDFIAVNGVGDLFEKSVVMLNHLAIISRAELWIRTRIKRMAEKILPASNVHVHFSIDQATVDLFNTVEFQANGFYTYQMSEGEPWNDELLKYAVVFAHDYEPLPDMPRITPSCPINFQSHDNICRSCRRCFNGEAVAYQKKVLA